MLQHWTIRLAIYLEVHGDESWISLFFFLFSWGSSEIIMLTHLDKYFFLFFPNVIFKKVKENHYHYRQYIYYLFHWLAVWVFCVLKFRFLISMVNVLRNWKKTEKRKKEKIWLIDCQDEGVNEWIISWLIRLINSSVDTSVNW